MDLKSILSEFYHVRRLIRVEGNATNWEEISRREFGDPLCAVAHHAHHFAISLFRSGCIFAAVDACTRTSDYRDVKLKRICARPPSQVEECIKCFRFARKERSAMEIRRKRKRRRRGGSSRGRKLVEVGKWRGEIYDCHTSRHVKLCSLRLDCYNLGT